RLLHRINTVRKRYFTKALVIAAFLSISGNASIVSAQDSTPSGLSPESSESICRETGELLSDDTILDIIINYEVNSGGLPRHLVDQNITDLREYRPSCCSIQREDNPYNRYRDILSDIFEPKIIFVIIGWDHPSIIVPRTVTTYRLDLCGSVLSR